MTAVFTPTIGSTITYATNQQFTLAISCIDEVAAAIPPAVAETPRVLQSIDVSVDWVYDGVTTTNGLSTNITGSYSADIFNHTVRFVDQGQSDKSQTPVTIPIADFEDHKEPLSFNVDFTLKKSIIVTMTAHWTNNTTDVGTFTISVINNIPAVKNWIADYMANKY
jgi:hypothetical protein